MIVTVVAGAAAAALQPSHLIALIGLALAAAAGRPYPRMVPLSFGAGLIAGLAAIAAAVGETPAGTGLVAVAVISGLVAAGAIALPGAVIVAAAAAAGVMIGLDSPPRVLNFHQAVAVLIGSGIASLGLFIGLVAIIERLHQPWQRLGCRIAGSWIAAAGVLVLAEQWLR